MIHNPNPDPSTAEFVAPARINLLGEHTDYTGGFVMPMAIPLTTVAAVAPSPDRAHHISSEMFSESLDFGRNDRSEARQSWTDYPVGVLREMQSLGIDPPPFRLSCHVLCFNPHHDLTLAPMQLASIERLCRSQRQDIPAGVKFVDRLRLESLLRELKPDGIRRFSALTEDDEAKQKPETPHSRNHSCQRTAVASAMLQKA